MGQPAPAPQPQQTATPAEPPALVSIDTGKPVADVADAHVDVVDNDSIVEAQIDVLNSDCSDGDAYGADSSAAISIHADIPSDLGGLSGDLTPDLGGLGSDLPVGDCLLGGAPDLCSVLSDIV